MNSDISYRLSILLSLFFFFFVSGELSLAIYSQMTGDIKITHRSALKKKWITCFRRNCPLTNCITFVFIMYNNKYLYR